MLLGLAIAEKGFIGVPFMKVLKKIGYIHPTRKYAVWFTGIQGTCSLNARFSTKNKLKLHVF